MLRFFAIRWCRLFLAAALLSLAANGASAATTIWTNRASGGPPILQEWDLSGNLLMTIPSAALHGYNGRGIAKIGNILYYTATSSNSNFAPGNSVYAYDLATNTDLGTVFTVPGANSLGPIAYDGASLYISSYVGTGNVYKYSLTGTPQGILNLGYCYGYTCDGIEIANGRLIANRNDADGPYDAYSLTGTPLTQAFITDLPAGNSGIAFDGTNYYVARPYYSTNQIAVFNGSGVYQYAITLPGAYDLEDLSVDYTNVLNPGILKICKVADIGVTVGTQFTFTANGNPISVAAGPPPGGNCVLAGSFAQSSLVTIQETGSPGYAVNAITVAPAVNLAGGPDLPNRKVQVTMGSGVTEVTYTNQSARQETGYLEICKQEAIRSTGNFTFTVNSGNQGPVTVPIGGCSPAMRVAAGQVTIHENPNPLGNMASCATIPTTRQGPCNPSAQTSTVTVVPGGTSTQTVAIITNRSRIFQIDEGSQVQDQRFSRSSAEGCDKIKVTQSLPPQCLCPPGEKGQGCGLHCEAPKVADAKQNKCVCPEGTEAKKGRCVKASGLLDDLHVGIGIGVGGGVGDGGGKSGRAPKGKTCEPNGPCP